MGSKVKLGIIGFGLATSAVVGPLTEGERYEVVACADPDPLSRERFVARYGSVAYESAEELFDKAALDAVYIATPTRLHEALTQMAFDHGVHVLVEKPISTSLDAAERMVAAAEAAGLVLMVNHKHSADRDVLGMWQLTRSGQLGRVRAVHRWHYTDWFYRSRADDERDPSVGGVVLRQGAHEFDMLRMLVPSVATSLRGWTGDWDASRPGEGAFHAFVECEDGTVISTIHSGYDRFRTEEFLLGPIDPEITGSSRRNLAGTSAEEEHLLKRTVGHPKPEGAETGVYGMTLMSCDGGDLRTSPGGGVWLYDDSGRHELKASGPSGTEVIVGELYDAITSGVAPLHDGSWGLAVLELCLAIRESQSVGGEVKLHRQRAVDWSSADRVIGERVMSAP